MARITGIHHTSFTVADLDRSLAFFCDVLEMEVLFVREVRDDYFGRIVGLPGCVVKAALLRWPGGSHHLELFQYVEPVGTPPLSKGGQGGVRPCDPGSSHLSFLVDDLPGFCQEMRAKRLDFVSEPVLITAGPNQGGYGVYLRDPNGILIELFQLPKRVNA